MRASIIRSIDSLQRLPVFPDDSTVSEAPRLHRYNLIYGFNGCGKTTLSRVFACLGTGRCHKDWAFDSTFEVTLTDGRHIKPETIDPTLKERTLVFNEDFLSTNLRWKEGEASPIFYLGSQQDLSERMEKKAKRAVVIDGRLQRVESILKKSRQAFAQHRTDRARLIEREVERDRRYIATSLEADYADYTYSESDLLDEYGIDAQQQVLRLDEPLPTLSRFSERPPEIGDLIREVSRLLGTTLGSISMDVLNENDQMLPWVKDGLDYHKSHSLESCLLCGNRLTDSRIRMLEAAIDDRYDTLVNKIAIARQMAEASRDRLAELKAGIPRKIEVIKAEHERFTDAAMQVISSIDAGRRIIEIAISLLTRKHESPNSRVAPQGLPKLSDADEWMSEYAERAKTFNKAIDAHNRAHREFKANQDAAREKLKRHYLAEGHEKYCELASEVGKAERVHGALKSHSGQLKRDVDDLRRQMREHGPAADRVNTTIHSYLGHKELEIAAKDEGYEIRRNGKVTTAPPSEGEKTAIALSYFLVLLEADGRKREDLIVVMDDPISSLDTRSLNYACNMVKSLDQVAQLITLTHNYNFMNEMKKWLRSGTEKEMEKRGKGKENATATLLFIDTVQPAGKESRRSRITELPKYLRDYESEYHYLFHMALRFLEHEDERADYFFVMPNVLRKILEVFLAFKRPGPSGLANKIDQLAREAEEIGIDQVRVRALGRLAHVESHGDNLDDLVSASRMTIEESKDSAEALLELIERMDGEHARRMRRQCRGTA